MKNTAAESVTTHQMCASTPPTAINLRAKCAGVAASMDTAEALPQQAPPPL